MKSLDEEFFDDPELRTVRLDDLGDVKSYNDDDPQNWTFVEARDQDRGVQIYSEGIYKVIRTKDVTPLVQQGVEKLFESDIEERMPTRLWNNRVVPSPSGEYITIQEVSANKNPDGTIRELKTVGDRQTIPVEFVKNVVSYDEVILDLLD